MVYLLEDEDELSDKDKISLIDDSKFEDQTLEFKNAQIKSDEEEDDYSSDEDNSNIINKNVGDSVVLMGDFIKKRKQKAISIMNQSMESNKVQLKGHKQQLQKVITKNDKQK